MPSEEKMARINLHSSESLNDQAHSRNRSERSSLRTSVKKYREVWLEATRGCRRIPRIQRKGDKQ